MLPDNFKAPPKRYRSLPFWSWNDRLDPEELAFQIEQFDEQGIGGFFMHSREGLETEYLGEDWARCVKAAVAEAQKRGMYAFIYDEDRWPSGAAGGRVTARGDDFRAKALVCYAGMADFSDDTVAVFRIDTNAKTYERISENDMGLLKLRDGEILASFKLKVSGPSEWFNDDAPADNLNPLTVSHFISETHERYREWVGDEFGKTVAGVFTDEPNVADRRAVYDRGRGFVPYTVGFDQSFRERFGYSLVENLPALFYDMPESFKVRHDYWRHVSQQFTNAYTRQIYEWCCKNGLASTGHFLYENELGQATRMNGAVMPHYMYQHIPGIDLLCDQTDEYLTVLQCVSAARQTGRKFVISEMYGCTGWAFDFEGQRRLGDWQFVLGVNLRCQHLALYSLAGCRKRDFPPCFNYNASWWSKHHVVEDYFARLTAALTAGEPQCDVLVLHPQSTVWGMMGAQPDGSETWDSDEYIVKADAFGKRFNDLLKELCLSQISCELGDEQIMEKLGSVSGGRLVVGERSYGIVLIAQAFTMTESTYRLLRDYVDAGGRLLALNGFPEMIDGEPQPERLNKLKKHRNVVIYSDEKRLIDDLWREDGEFCLLRDGKPAYGYLAQLRRDGGVSTLFIVNSDRENGGRITINLKGENDVYILDPLTGSSTKATARIMDGHTIFEKEFLPAESVLLMYKKCDAKKAGGHTAQGCADAGVVWRKRLYTGPASFERLSPNVLVLDKCTGGLMGQAQTYGEDEVWVVQEKLREALSLRPIYYNGLPQRYKWINKKSQSGEAFLCFSFSSEQAFSNVKVAVERLENYRVFLNGCSVDANIDGYYFDKSIKTALLPPLQKGENVLRLEFTLKNSTELENIYLIGDFGVSPRRVLVEEPKTLFSGDYTGQGYFHYAGDMRYIFEADIKKEAGLRYYIRLGRLLGVNAEVRINGEYAGDIPWPSARVDITGGVRDGRNEISITLSSTQRNLFGPFHNVKGDVKWTDWRAFRTTGSEHTENYNVRPCGLCDDVELIAVRCGE